MTQFKIKPCASFTEVESKIWPIDDFSRKIIIKYCHDSGIKFTEIFTSMGTTTLQFSSQDYYIVKSFMDRYSFSPD